MKKLASTLSCLALASLVSAANPVDRWQPTTKDMASTFVNIPDSQKLACYWYWISDNISAEGVVKDLHAMKQAGINRAYIGNIGDSSVKYGKVKLFTPEWWNIIHTALKTASELGIEIGIFNCPGWSQSGGPWIKPSQSMRYLAQKQITVKGGQLFKGKLPEVGKDAQDVRVIAFPAAKSLTKFTAERNTAENAIYLSAPKEETVRSITINVAEKPQKTYAHLYVEKNGNYELLKDIEIDRSNPAIQVGYIPYAPIVESVPEMKANRFKLVLDSSIDGVASVDVSDVPRVERYPEKTFGKMFQTPHPMWTDYMWNVQPEYPVASGVIDPKNVIDVTENMQPDGTFEWKVPKGDWIIMRTAMVTTGQTNAPASPEGTGLEVDKMSKQLVAYHFDQFIGEILRRIPAEDRRTFKVVVEDSYETGGQDWTDGMAEDFEKRYGYSAIKFLPTLYGNVVESEEASDRFLWDLRRLVADKVAYDYVGGLREVAHKHGLTTWLENYGHWGYPGEFLQYGGQSDEIAGEFWSVGDLGDIENKVASSCGHTYGKQKVWAESFTCGGPDFSRYPGEMKPRGDRFFTEGINSTLLHVYIQQPDEREPGINAPYGNEFNRHNTWFPQLDTFAKYLKRVNYMLQQGRYIADVAYFIGEDAPKMTGIRDPEIPKGYSYDFINAEILENQAHVENHQLVLNSGMRYRVLVLPPLKTMRPEVIKKLQGFVKDGLILCGGAPEKSPSLENYPEADKEVASIAKEMWGIDNNIHRRAYGKGTIYTDTTLEGIFNDLKLRPDFVTAIPDDSLLFIHRQLNNSDVYFISNQANRSIDFTGQFRVDNGNPELWDPQSTEIRNLPEYLRHDGMTAIPVRLAPHQSTFVVFDKDGQVSTGTALKTNYPEEASLSVAGPWKVSFDAAKGGPKTEQTFQKLIDWTSSADPTVKYYSGSATYTTTIKLKKLPQGEVYLDLGKVMVMAKVKVNGTEVGGVWTPPYRVNVTSQLRKGKNTIEVEVVNNWRNKLIEQEAKPESERTTWHTYTYLKATDELQSSGLLGPVKLMYEK